MLGDLIAVVKGLAGVFTWKRQLDDEKRKKFASLCDQISNVLERVSQTSGDRRQSINLCAELRQYVEPIRDVAHGTLACDEINRLATELDRVCDAWEQLASTDEPSSRFIEGYIDQWRRGQPFRGLANRCVRCDTTKVALPTFMEGERQAVRPTHACPDPNRVNAIRA